MHITENAGIELADFRILLQLLEGTHANEKASLTYAELKKQTKFVVALDVVNDLHDGAIGRRRVVKDERTGILHNGEPLPGRVFFCGECLEYRMFRIGENTKGTGADGLVVILGDGFEHTVVPIVGLEEAA